MKVLYVFRSLAVWGGIERVLVEKMNYLATKYDYEVYMITSDQGAHQIPYHLDSNVKFFDLGIQFHKQYQFYGLRRVLDIRRRIQLFEHRLSEQIKKIRPDVIVCTTADHVNSIAKVKEHIPLIVESHSICSRTLRQKGFKQRYSSHLLLKGMAKAACLVSLTEGDAKAWRQYTSNVHVIPNIVHLNRGSVSALNQKRVIFVGRFDYQKRPMEALRIWQQVYPSFPEWHLDIYGEGEQLAELEKASQALHMNIHIHRPTGKIFDGYRNSSIMISTSLFEPFGLVIPEAMSCGLPVIAYDCPFGPSSIIESGKDGYLVANNDVKAFAKTLSLLMSDEEIRCRIGNSAITASSRFSADNIMPKWKYLFENIAFPSKAADVFSQKQ